MDNYKLRRKLGFGFSVLIFGAFTLLGAHQGLTNRPYFDLGALIMGIGLVPIVAFSAWRLYDDKTRLRDQFSSSLFTRVCVVLALSFYIIVGAGMVWLYNQKAELTKDDFIIIPATTAAEPYYDRQDSDNPSVTLIMQEYPGFEFPIYVTKENQETVSDLLEQLTQYERVLLTIAKSEYDMKLSKEQEPDFVTKYFSYQTITLYKLNEGGRIYRLKFPWQRNKDDDWFFYGFIGFVFIAIPLLLIITLTWIYKKNNIDQRNRNAERTTLS